MAEIVSDDFNRANAATLGSNWTNDGTGLQVIGNACGANSGSGTECRAAYTGAGWTGGADHYTSCRVTALAAGSEAGPIARFLVGPQDYYYAEVKGLGSSTLHVLWRVDAGGFANIGSWTQVITAADVIRLEAEGTTIRVKVNGVEKVSVTNSVVASGIPGLMIYENGTAGTSTLDDMSAGDLTPDVGGGGDFVLVAN